MDNKNIVSKIKPIIILLLFTLAFSIRAQAYNINAVPVLNESF